MTFESAMRIALIEAEKFVGATAPNPPVAAVILDEQGQILACAAHERAGQFHAERRAIELCRANGTIEQAHTIVVTLEPCNHYGRTPPCVLAILDTPIRRVVYGASDPNPVAQGGHDHLKERGVEVISSVLETECNELIRGFRSRILSRLPWITIKTAWSRQGSMIPPVGEKTFTSLESLKLAHELRKRSDAIVTGSGTVLADAPEFTVRHISDHLEKIRQLALLDRRHQVSDDWIQAASRRGFQVFRAESLDLAFRKLADLGCLEVLVEAGPLLSASVLESGLWNEHVRIQQQGPHEPDIVQRFRNDNGPQLR